MAAKNWLLLSTSADQTILRLSVAHYLWDLSDHAVSLYGVKIRQHYAVASPVPRPRGDRHRTAGLPRMKAQKRLRPGVLSAPRIMFKSAQRGGTLRRS